MYFLQYILVVNWLEFFFFKKKGEGKKKRRGQAYQDTAQMAGVLPGFLSAMAPVYSSVTPGPIAKTPSIQISEHARTEDLAGRRFAHALPRTAASCYQPKTTMSYQPKRQQSTVHACKTCHGSNLHGFFPDTWHRRDAADLRLRGTACLACWQSS